MVFGVFGGIGFDEGGVGTVGGGFGIEGDDGGGGVFWVQPAAIALSAMTTSVDSVDLVEFIGHSFIGKNYAGY